MGKGRDWQASIRESELEWDGMQSEFQLSSNPSLCPSLPSRTNPRVSSHFLMAWNFGKVQMCPIPRRAEEVDPLLADRTFHPSRFSGVHLVVHDVDHEIGWSTWEQLEAIRAIKRLGAFWGDATAC